ncbi:MAG: dTMP kinase [Pseudomonadota bacterium]
MLKDVELSGSIGQIGHKVDMIRGRFITLEGGEGTGKSTQAAFLKDALERYGITVHLTREPGGAPLAERIRTLILDEKPTASVAEFLLFAAARCEHVAATIRPALERGDWVICDRYIDSTRVYQGELEDIDKDLILTIEQFCVAPWLPDLTIILDMPVAVSTARVQARGDLSRFDNVDEARHDQIRRGFLNIADAEPERCVVVSAMNPAEQIAEDIEQIVSDRLMGTNA